MKGFVLFCVFLTLGWIIWKYLPDDARAVIKNYFRNIWYIPVVVIAGSFFTLYLLSLFEIKVF